MTIKPKNKRERQLLNMMVIVKRCAHELDPDVNHEDKNGAVMQTDPDNRNEFVNILKRPGGFLKWYRDFYGVDFHDLVKQTRGTMVYNFLRGTLQSESVKRVIGDVE